MLRHAMEIEEPPSETAAEPKRSRTSARTSFRGSRVDLITRGEPRRRWSTEQKQAIAAKSFEPCVSSMDVAREYGISSGLISTWRRALLAAQPYRERCPVRPRPDRPATSHTVA
jgi:transposase-like protein